MTVPGVKSLAAEQEFQRREGGIALRQPLQGQPTGSRCKASPPALEV